MKEVNEMVTEELDQLVKDIDARRTVLKMEEMKGVLDTLRPGKYIHIKKGRRGEKIGKVTVLYEDGLLFQPFDLDYKLRIKFVDIDDVYQDEETANSNWNKIKMDRFPPKVEPTTTTPKAPEEPKKKAPFGRSK